MTNTPSDSFSPVISYEHALGKMRFILPPLMLITLGLSLWGRNWDRQCFLWINTTIPRALPDSLLPVWDTTMITLTYLGDTHVMLWMIMLISLPWWMAVGRKTPEKLSLYLVVFAIVLVLATLVSQGLKEIAGTLRPAGVLPAEALRILGETLNYRSFPSGHTVTAFAGICTLLPIIPAAWRWGALTLATGIGFSRIGVGAHWPIDVAAGAFLGIAAGMMGWRIAFWLQQKGLAENTFWKKFYQGLAMLGLFFMAANVAYTPFYEFEHRAIRLGLIGLCLTLALLFGYYQRSRLE
ncbi:MAG: phosphatase PAP2 family protein [Nitrosomonadales bacterium]|nr:phosphatase PAP2 family protein [Nitrosomonadales bacterium]